MPCFGIASEQNGERGERYSLRKICVTRSLKNGARSTASSFTPAGSFAFQSAATGAPVSDPACWPTVTKRAGPETGAAPRQVITISIFARCFALDFHARQTNRPSIQFHFTGWPLTVTLATPSRNAGICRRSSIGLENFGSIVRVSVKPSRRKEKLKSGCRMPA